MKQAQPNSTVDVRGMVKRFGDCQELVSKKMDKVLFKRDLNLAEDSIRVHEYIYGSYLCPQRCSLILVPSSFVVLLARLELQGVEVVLAIWAGKAEEDGA
jgi:hypothetical protein